jgi:imidazolonepropionase-like amidohydrolase
MKSMLVCACLADIVILDGDPLADIHDLLKVKVLVDRR